MSESNEPPPAEEPFVPSLWVPVSTDFPPEPDRDAEYLREVTALTNEGVRLSQTERRDEAESHLRRALALAEEKLGPGHEAAAICLNNLGDFLSQHRRFAEAEPLLRRALSVKERIHGVDHAETGHELNNLALVLRRMENLAEAESLYRRVLTIFQHGHGHDSLEVAGVLNNLAQILTHTGRSEAAEPLMHNVIRLFERHFGADHPNVAIALNNLARLLASTGRAAAGEPFSRRQLRIFQIFENTHGQRHAYKGAALDGYGTLLEGLGWPEDAIRARIRDLLAGHEVPELSAPGTSPAAADSSSVATADFDRLSKIANSPGSTMTDADALFGAAFRLEHWLFISRGTFPDVHPYVASNAGIERGAAMVKAFTDTKRLQAFARENALTDPGTGDVLILSLPVASILPTMESLTQNGVTHIHFNADHDSYGFYVPLVQLPIIQRHLAKKGLLKPE